MKDEAYYRINAFRKSKDTGALKMMLVPFGNRTSTLPADEGDVI
ncbi:MAG: hypothetical protein ABIN89_02010 [Chitinophagaceae bacterium]